MTKTPNPLLSPIKTNRDVLLFQFTHNQVLVVGCDSAGGIGPKPLDKIKVSGYILGKFTARAALMEVLAVGANPVCIVDALGVEPEPTGSEILKGIRAEAAKAGLDPEHAVTGSTEKNVTVEQTGIGVTVIGTCKKEDLKIGTSESGDVVVAVGIPCVSDEVLPAERAGNIAESVDILRLRNLKFIHEIIPVGSTGISHEIETMATGAKLKFNIVDQPRVDVRKSAGPATVLLVSLPFGDLPKLKKIINKPIHVTAELSS